MNQRIFYAVSGRLSLRRPQSESLQKLMQALAAMPVFTPEAERQTACAALLKPEVQQAIAAQVAQRFTPAQGAVPDDFWSIYSAIANTQGGVVLLGVREKNGLFDVAGIQNVAKLRKALFDCLNNRQKLSVNLLTDSSVPEIELEGKTILAIEIPRATRKLAADLKVPFILKDGFRQDDTPLHRALREALINALVHSDYSDRASVLVIKRPSRFVFRNPGGLRVPAAQALQGGESDCRNRTLHQMFLMIGLGERAGSGLPKIRRNYSPPTNEK